MGFKDNICQILAMRSKFWGFQSQKKKVFDQNLSFFDFLSSKFVKILGFWWKFWFSYVKMCQKFGFKAQSLGFKPNICQHFSYKVKILVLLGQNVSKLCFL